MFWYLTGIGTIIRGDARCAKKEWFFLDADDVAQIVILIILVLLSGLFSSAETALTACNSFRIRSMADEGDKRAKKLIRVLDDRPKMLSALLVGNNVVNLSASSLSTVLATKALGSRGAGIATGILTFVILIFGEVSPKTLATIYSDRMSLLFCGPVSVLMKVLTPVIAVVNFLARGVLRLFGVDPDRREEPITEEELRTIVDVSHEEGVIERDERNMIKNVVDFGDSQAKDIMVPRVDMTMVAVTAGYPELMDIFRKYMFTRLPVYEDSVDNIIGIINMKDILLYHEGDPFSVRDYLRKVFYTYEYKGTAELLTEMRAANAGIAIVLDEYGSAAGLLTLEDLVEEIVGEIRDEYDVDEKEDVIEVSGREYLAEGSAKLADVNEKLGLRLESEDYDTIGGFVIGLLDHLPSAGEEAGFEGIRFRVERMQKKRIETIRILLP